MKKAVLYKWWGIYFAIALVCRLAFGECPAAFFAFPVNAALLFAGMAGVWVLHKEKPQSLPFKILSSPDTTFLLLGITFVTCVVMGFELSPSTASWWLVMTLVAMLLHLSAVVFRGLAVKRRHKLRFALIHVGLLVVLGTGLAGSADTREWRMLAVVGEPVQQAFDARGGRASLDEPLVLQAFDVDYYPDGTPQNYTAKVTIGGREAILKVNHPHGLSWSKDLYLADYEHVPAGMQPRYCVLQLVEEPWKWFMWIGIWMMIAGSLLLFVQGVPALQKKGGDATV